MIWDFQMLCGEWKDEDLFNSLRCYLRLFKRLPRVLACNNSCAVERRLCTANLDSFIDSKDTLSKVSMMSRFFKGKSIK